MRTGRKGFGPAKRLQRQRDRRRHYEQAIADKRQHIRDLLLHRPPDDCGHLKKTEPEKEK